MRKVTLNSPARLSLAEIAMSEWIRAKFNLHPGKMAKELKKHSEDSGIELRLGLLRSLEMDSIIACGHCFALVEIELRGRGMKPDLPMVKNLEEISTWLGFDPTNIAEWLKAKTGNTEIPPSKREEVTETLIEMARAAHGMLLGSEQEQGALEWTFQEVTRILQEEGVLKE
jgi:hypothetical protein